MRIYSLMNVHIAESWSRAIITNASTNQCFSLFYPKDRPCIPVIQCPHISKLDYTICTPHTPWMVSSDPCKPSFVAVSPMEIRLTGGPFIVMLVMRLPSLLKDNPASNPQAPDNSLDVDGLAMTYRGLDEKTGLIGVECVEG